MVYFYKVLTIRLLEVYESRKALFIETYGKYFDLSNWELQMGELDFKMQFFLEGLLGLIINK